MVLTCISFFNELWLVFIRGGYIHHRTSFVILCNASMKRNGQSATTYTLLYTHTVILRWKSKIILHVILKVFMLRLILVGPHWGYACQEGGHLLKSSMRCFQRVLSTSFHGERVIWIPLSSGAMMPKYIIANTYSRGAHALH